MSILLGHRRNRIVNGAMQISQENGNTAGTTNAYFIADQWQLATSGGAVSGQRVVVATPGRSLNRLRISVTTAKAVLAAGDFLAFFSNIEGLMVEDFAWGSSLAQQAVLRFVFKGPAGTYHAAIRNAASTRAFTAPFTISAGQANTDQIITITIPRDLTGTWPTGAVLGLAVWITLAAGSTFTVGTANAWTATAAIASPSQSNGLATLGNVFELGDVGLYLDSGNSGAAPKWEEPDYALELVRCQRYFSNTTATQYSGNVTSGATYYATGFFPVPMRVAPSLSGVNFVATSFPTTGTYDLITTTKYREGRVANATGNAAQFGSTVSANARP